MLRSRIALWMRGAGAMVAVSAMLTGCVVDAIPEEPEEDVAESANELDQATVSSGLEDYTGDSQKDPDPVPWRPTVRGNDDPTPDPDSAPQVIPAPGPGHDES